MNAKQTTQVKRRSPLAVRGTKPRHQRCWLPVRPGGNESRAQPTAFAAALVQFHARDHLPAKFHAGEHVARESDEPEVVGQEDDEPP